jgi:hypothetical protein
MSGDETVTAPLLEELQEVNLNDLDYYRFDSAGYESHIQPTFMCLPNATPAYRDCDGTNPHNPPQSMGNNWATTLIGSWPIGMQVDVPGGIPHNPMSEEQISLRLA